jgi:Tfp pilus assembly protein PilN
MSQQINLFNPIFLKTKKYFSATAMAQSLGLLVLGSALVAGYAHFQVESLSKEAAETNKQLADAQMQLAKVKAENAPLQKSQALQNQVAKSEMEMQSLKQVFDILQKGDIGNTKGYAEYLRAFSRQIVDGVWLTNLTLVGAGNEIGIDGRAVHPELVATYMNRLKREPIMQGKSFGTLQMQVPKTENTAKNDLNAASNGAKQDGLAGYIEFSLN